MQPKPSIIMNEKGSVIVAALMILALLTIIGISASNTSITEGQIATNSLLHERAFYTAEAGMEHAKELLKDPFVEQNEVKVATGAEADWDFAIADATDSTFEGGVEWVDTTLDGVAYTVTVWNNGDGGGATDDNDGLIFIRSVARGPRGALCRIETLLDGNSTALAITGDYAQEGSGAGKGYMSQDTEAITDFSDQL
jgi:hypothetical protein